MLVTALLIIGGLLFAGPVVFGLIIARWQKEWAERDDRNGPLA